MNIIAIEEHVVKSEGVLVDLILWRRFHAQTPGLLEYTLAMPQNQHLEFCDAVLPIGTKVYVPIPAPRSQPEVSVITLWS